MRGIKIQTFAPEVNRYELESWSSAPSDIDFPLNCWIVPKITACYITGRILAANVLNKRAAYHFKKPFLLFKQSRPPLFSRKSGIIEGFRVQLRLSRIRRRFSREFFQVRRMEGPSSATS